MSVSDPAIKDLKACIQKFLDETREIHDENRHLSSFCHKLELIFHAGLKKTNKYFSSTQEPYDWLLDISKDKNWEFSFQFSNTLYELQKDTYLKTKLGKFRLFLRYSLVRKCLHVPVEYLVKSRKFSTYYHENCILGDEILAEILLSVFLQCGTLKFNLDLSNVYFLETTWLLPDVWKVELVPSQSLGISVAFSDERAVIVDLDSNGAAAECEKIDIGDVLENINGVQINSSSRGKSKTLLKKQKNTPITIVIIKALKESNSLYIPLRKFLLDVNLDILSLQNKKKEEEIQDLNPRKLPRNGFSCIFVGAVKITEGDSRQIEKTIREVVKYRHCIGENTNKFDKEIFLQIDDLSIKIIDIKTEKVTFNHSYMDISSCGSSIIYRNYFGYIKGNEPDETGNFTCLIFYTKNRNELATILSGIGQGFKRTNCAV